MDIGQAYMEEALRSLRGHKRLAEGALSQLSDKELFETIDSESNSVAIILKHMAGNMRSRWTDFLSTDGEKPDRNRDQEFVIDEHTTREALMNIWERGWQYVFDTLQALQQDDVSRIVTIRGQEHTVLQAINRALAHYAYHVGQIVFLAKHLKSSEWKTLSVPRGKSEELNAEMQTRKSKEFRHP
ncbi:MAG TPA: DinB family protein [Terriglobales bacterium]